MDHGVHCYVKQPGRNCVTQENEKILKSIGNLKTMGTYPKKNKYHWTTILETLAGNFLGGAIMWNHRLGIQINIMVKEPRHEPLAFSGGSPEISRTQISFFQTSGRKPKDSMLNCMRICFFLGEPRQTLAARFSYNSVCACNQKWWRLYRL